MIEGRLRHATQSNIDTVPFQHSPFLFCIRPCGQIEQLACSRSITLRGLSDQAVTLHCLTVDKHTLIVTHALIYADVRGAVSLCCSSAWSVEQRVEECSPGRAQQGEDLGV